MLDHSATSILPFLLKFCCYLLVLLPLLRIWLSVVLRQQARDGQEAPPGGATKPLYCPACEAETDQSGCKYRESTPRPECILRVLKALAEGLRLRASARVFNVDPNTVESWLR